MPVLWAVVLIAAVAGAVAAFIGVGPGGASLEPVGVLFAMPLGIVAAIAIGGLRDRWSRGLASVGVVASAMTVGIAGLLYAAMSVGQGLGALLSVVAGHSSETRGTLLGGSAVASIVSGLGCLFAVIVGPPPVLVVEPLLEPALEPRLAPGVGTAPPPGLEHPR